MTNANGNTFDTIGLKLYDKMSHVVDTIRIPQASEEKILGFEKLIKHQLPEDYRRFLKDHNGGTPINPAIEYFCYKVKWDESNFSFLQTNEKYGLSILFTLDPEFIAHKRKVNILDVSYLDLIEKYKEFLDLEDMGYPHVPNDMIPIGDAPVENDMILLGIKGNRLGKVYYYMLQEDPDKPYENIGLIADNFDKFLLSLHSCEE